MGVIHHADTADLEIPAVLKTIDFTYTQGGLAVLNNVLRNPCDTVTKLNERKRVIVNVEDVLERSKESVQALLKTCAGCQASLDWFVNDGELEKQWLESTQLPKIVRQVLCNDEHVFAIYNYYKTLVAPIAALVSPMACILVPFLFLRLKFGIRIPFRMFTKLMFKTSQEMMLPLVSLIVYAQGILSAFDNARVSLKVNRIIWKRYRDLNTYIDAATVLRTHFKSALVHGVFGSVDEVFQNSIPRVQGPFSMLCNMGSIIKHVYDADIERDIGSLIRCTSMIDALVSIITAKNTLKLTYARPMTHDKYPHINAVGIRHVCLDRETVVKNDVCMGGDTHPNNIIITGPNAGGKSTFMRAVLINVLLAQSITLVAADVMTYTPFSSISTHMNVPDIIGEESLFEAEMRRCREKLDIVKKCKGFVLYAMDEVFSSTQHVDGIAGAYAVSKRLAKSRKSMGLIATHFEYLTRLAREEDFENYKMVVQKNDNGDISFPYTLEKGISDQYIALELLAQNGFDAELVASAVRIRDDVLAASHPCMSSCPQVLATSS